MKIKCQTVFDCTCTGVTGHFRAGQIPCVDRSGQAIASHSDWIRSRNQQRNYETLLQIFGLKTQPLDISPPRHTDSVWEFEFSVESPAVFSLTDSTDPLAGLKRDCNGVPMIAEVSDIAQTMSMLECDKNIWFFVINTPTEN
jgi:hypothetical protein